MWLLIVVPIAAVVIWMVSRRVATRQMKEITDRRRPSSKVVSDAEFVDGSRHMRVALALTDSALFYENIDMQATLDREWIEEVEYENELSTGQVIGAGTVLRLRSASQTFEFVLPKEAIAQWKTFLPAQRMTHAT